MSVWNGVVNWNPGTPLVVANQPGWLFETRVNPKAQTAVQRMRHRRWTAPDGKEFNSLSAAEQDVISGRISDPVKAAEVRCKAGEGQGPPVVGSGKPRVNP